MGPFRLELTLKPKIEAGHAEVGNINTTNTGASAAVRTLFCHCFFPTSKHLLDVFASKQSSYYVR